MPKYQKSPINILYIFRYQCTYIRITLPFISKINRTSNIIISNIPWLRWWLKLTRLNQEEIENIKRLITSTEIETVN